MKKKKWIYILLIFVLTIFVLFFYTAFNGNPVTKQLSKLTLNTYLKKTYPGDEFTINKPFYNIKDSGYDYKVKRIGDPIQTEHNFFITGILITNVHYDGIYYENQDTILINKFEKEAREELTNLLQKIVPEMLEINVQIEILKGKYDLETVWNKKLELEKPLYIYIAIDSRKLSNKDILLVTSEIQKTLNKNQYIYRNVTIDGKVIDVEVENEIEDLNYWHVKHSISFEIDTILDLKQVKQFEY